MDIKARCGRYHVYMYQSCKSLIYSNEYEKLDKNCKFGLILNYMGYN